MGTGAVTAAEAACAERPENGAVSASAVSYTHLRAHET